MVKEYNILLMESDSDKKESPGYFSDFETYKIEYKKNPKHYIKKLGDTFNFAIYCCDFKTFTDLIDLHKNYLLSVNKISLNQNIFLSISHLGEGFDPYFSYMFNNGFKPENFNNKKEDILTKLFMLNLSNIANHITSVYNFPKSLSNHSQYLRDLLLYHEYDNLKELIDMGYQIKNNNVFYYGFSNCHIHDAIKIYQLLPNNFTEEENIEHIFFNTATRALNCESLCKLNEFFKYNFDTNYVHEKIMEGKFNSYTLLCSKEHIDFFHNNGIVYQKLFDSNPNGPFWSVFLHTIITSQGNPIFEAIEEHGFVVNVNPAYADRVISDFICNYCYKQPRGLSDFSNLYPFMKFMGFDIFQHTTNEFCEFIKSKSSYLLNKEQISEVDVHIQKNILNNTVNRQALQLQKPRI